MHEITYRFTAKNGREVILRTLRWEDLDDIENNINRFLDEDIFPPAKVTKEQSVDIWGRVLARLGDEEFWLVAEVDGKVVAHSKVCKNNPSSNIGSLGMNIRKDYHDLGIGTEMLKTLISHAKMMNIKMLSVAVLSTDKRSIHVYKKLGFKETGQQFLGKRDDWWSGKTLILLEREI